jgi:glycine hydroxymethyltransferase
VGIAHVVTSTMHKTLGGPRAGFIMCDEEFGSAIDRAVFPGLQGGPLMHVIAGKAVAFGQCLTPEFRERQQRTVDNCQAMADVLVGSGIDLVTGGTDNHLVLVDLSKTPLTGVDGEARLDRAGITVNKNGVPFDERPPTVTSGVRIGTAALTTRGMGPDELREVGSIIAEALTPETTDADLDALRQRSKALGDRFPLYPELIAEAARV